MTKEMLQIFIDTMLNSIEETNDCNSFMAGVNEGIREACEKLQEIIDLE